MGFSSGQVNEDTTATSNMAHHHVSGENRRRQVGIENEELVHALTEQQHVGDVAQPREGRALVPFFANEQEESHALPPQVSGALQPPSAQYAPRIAFPFPPPFRVPRRRGRTRKAESAHYHNQQYDHRREKPSLQSSSSSSSSLQQTSSSSSSSSSSSASRTVNVRTATPHKIKSAQSPSSNDGSQSVQRSHPSPPREEQRQHCQRVHERQQQVKSRKNPPSSPANGANAQLQRQQRSRRSAEQQNQQSGGRGVHKDVTEELFAGGLYETSPKPSSVPMPDFAPTPQELSHKQMPRTPDVYSLRRVRDLPLLTPQEALELSGDKVDSTAQQLEPMLHNANIRTLAAA